MTANKQVAKMIDIQDQNDIRQIPLKMVGIKNIVIPLLIPTKSGKPQSTTGTVSFFTDLSHNNRGSHMSRFVEILYKNRHNHLTFALNNKRSNTFNFF